MHGKGRHSMSPIATDLWKNRTAKLMCAAAYAHTGARLTVEAMRPTLLQIHSLKLLEAVRGDTVGSGIWCMGCCVTWPMSCSRLAVLSFRLVSRL